MKDIHLVAASGSGFLGVFFGAGRGRGRLVLLVLVVLSVLLGGCPPVDAVSPGVVVLGATSIRGGGATITWVDPDDDDLDYILLSWRSASGGDARSARVEEGVQSAAITDLTDAPYVFTAVSVDAAGNRSAVSAEVMVVVDAVAPAAVADIVLTVAAAGITLGWSDPVDSDFSHVLVTWTPVGGAPAQPHRVAAGDQSATISGLTAGNTYTFTIASVDTTGNTAAVTLVLDVGAPFSSMVGNVTAATSINGTITLRWSDPVDVTDVADIAITGEPAPTAARIVALGVQTVTITDVEIAAEYTFIVRTRDRDGVVANAGVAITAAPAYLPVALFSIGDHEGNFGFEACETYRATDTGEVARALRGAGYTKAVFFGSAPNYGFNSLATDTDALGVSGGAAPPNAQLAARPVVVYTDATPASPTTMFGAAGGETVRTIGSVTDVSAAGGWQNNGYDVVGALGADVIFWSFTRGAGLYDSAKSCDRANSNGLTDEGVVGNETGIVTTISVACANSNPVYCVAR